jgi:dihydrofolate synthase/folylpolyglutamate synthase
VTPGGAGTPRHDGWYGPPTEDPLAARLFPPLPGRVLWGLDRIQRIMAAVGSPHRSAPALVVGGTNGKGSVAHLWASILQASGLRTGLYTSPHLVHFRERIRVDGEPLPGAFLEEVADELRSPILKRQPSFYEATTALALTAFARAEVDVMVLEVGLGGRLDAVNVVDPILTAITNVGLEHQELLGPDLASIAREKAGIFRAGVPAFTAADRPPVLRVLAEAAASLGLPLARVATPHGSSSLAGDPPCTRLTLQTRTWGELELRTTLLGAHQRLNVALAVRSLEALPPRLVPPRRAVVEGVGAARVPGRLELREGPGGRVLLDVAHNEDGMCVLKAALAELSPEQPVVAVVGIVADKPAEAMLRELRPAVSGMVLCTPPSAPTDRRWDPAAMAAALDDPEVEVAPGAGGELTSALEQARKRAGPRGLVLVTGSFYTVGAALEALDSREAAPLSGG